MTIPRRPDGWFKTSRSPDNQDCVEVKFGAAVDIRDTKDRDGGQLALPASAWSAFLAGLK
jgi:hypothetical protein